jgi:2-keto-3-deoxy-galactonokinase
MWKASLADIVKTRDGFQRTPLMAGIGGAEFVNDISEQELLAAVRAVRARAVEHPVSHMHAAMAPEPFVMQPHVDVLRGEEAAVQGMRRSDSRSHVPALLA